MTEVKSNVFVELIKLERILAVLNRKSYLIYFKVFETRKKKHK